MFTGRMTCDFTSFSTVFQSYQDNGRVIMKNCVQWNPFAIEKTSASIGDRSRDQTATESRTSVMRM